MRKLRILFTTVAIFTFTFYSIAAIPTVAVSSPANTSVADNPRLSVTEQLKLTQMKFFVSLSPQQYEKMKGKKLNAFERFTFKISQRRMKKMIKLYDYGDGPTTMAKIGWLLKGLLLGPIALILGYIFLKDEERELIKWIWFGFAGFAIIVAVLLLM